MENEINSNQNLPFDFPVNGDQSAFVGQAEKLQPPPETIKPEPTPEMSVKIKKRRQQIKYVSLGLGLFLVVLILLAFILRQPQTLPEAVPTPTLGPTTAPSVLELQLKSLDQVLDEANPYKPALDPPPVDMNVIF